MSKWTWLALVLAGCNQPPSDAPDRAGVACLHGHLYGYEYVSRSRPTYPLFGEDGKPIPCSRTPLK